MNTTRVNMVGGDAYSFTGGIQAMNRFLVRELGEAGLLRQAFFLWDGDENVSKEGLALRAKGWVRFFGRNRLRFILAQAWQALRCPGDVWLCAHLNYALLTLMLTGWRRKRVALLIYASELDDHFTPLKRFALKQVGTVIVISNYTREKTEKAGVETSRIKVMYIGVDTPSPDWQPGRTDALDNLVLFVGRMDERYKGQQELLEAMVHLRGRVPGLRLVFVGGGRALEHWQAEARRLDLTNCVEFRGRVPDEELTRLYQTATVFAMPSANEGFGLVYVEAMARGLPCIASNVDAAREIVVDGETGFCVPARDPAALADAIERIVRTPELRARFSAASRSRFVEHFTVEKYRERVLATLSAWCGGVVANSN